MLLVEPRTLVDKLSPTCRKAFERAAGASVTARHREITVEHVLLALMDEPESDLSALLDHYRVDTSAARSALHRYVGALQSGSSGRPVLSATLLEWLQDAWVQGSAEHGETSLRSGALLLRWLLVPARYSAVAPDGLDAVPRDELKRSLAGLTASTAEARATERFASPAAGARADRSEGEGALAKFATNLTARAKEGKLDPVLGREPEVRQMVDILCRRRKNNPILLGDPGVGKTALVEGLALRIAEGNIPSALALTQVVTLDLGALQAGAGVKGELERRLGAVIDEVKASPVPIVLFIDEAHTLIGAGGPQGGGDMANLLKPALARGELRTIAATTWGEYKRYFEKDPALERRFQPVKVGEPSTDAAIVMLRGVARKLEVAHGVTIRDEAVRAAVTLSSRYVAGRKLPDKAIDLLDTSAARVRVLRGAEPSVVEDARAHLAALDSRIDAFERDARLAVATPSHAVECEHARASRDEQKGKLADLEARLVVERTRIARVDALRAAIDCDGDEEVRAASRAELSAALSAIAATKGADRLLYADVDEALVASVVSDYTGIPVGRMVGDDVTAILGLEAALGARVRGQEGALAVIARELRAARSGLKAKEAPLGVFLLVGPSGVGKTETALGLADKLFGGERFIVTVNMSELQERHAVSRLIGSPPGYIGYGEGGILTEAVRQRPYSVVLLDEVEKADREVMNLFYQVFDKGTLSDGEGRAVDFSNTVIVMTSNLATDIVTAAADPSAAAPSQDELVSLVKPCLTAYFKPALLARMTIVPYVPIRRDALLGIVEKKLGEVADRALEAHGVALVVDPAVAHTIAERCREVDSGARNVDHILRGTLLPLVSGALLRDLAAGTASASRPLYLRVAATGELVCSAEVA